jgi:hypothetical protein
VRSSIAPRLVRLACDRGSKATLSMVSHGMGDQKPYHLELLTRLTQGTLSRWSRLHLQSLTPTNPHWARVVGYGPFSLWVIHKEGLCPSSGDINRLMMMMMYIGRYGQRHVMLYTSSSTLALTPLKKERHKVQSV